MDTIGGTHDRNAHDVESPRPGPVGEDVAGPPSPDAEDGRTIPLQEEELVPRKQTQVGAVQIRRELVTEHRTVEVPVTREEVVVERRPPGRDPSERAAEPGDHVEGQLEPGETLRVPLIEEEVVIEKRPVVVEEAVIGKREVQGTEQVSGTVRREEPVVRTQGDVKIHGDVGATGAGRPAMSRALRSRGLLLGLGARSLAAVGAGLGVGWLYRRWQQERRRPLNRLRRKLRGAAS